MINNMNTVEAFIEGEMMEGKSGNLQELIWKAKKPVLKEMQTIGQAWMEDTKRKGYIPTMELFLDNVREELAKD